MTRTMWMLVLAVLLGTSLPALTADLPVGFLCCNMRSDGSKIIDINYDDPGFHLIAVGTPIRVLSVSHNRVDVSINGQNQYIKNVYSRDLSSDAFVSRYIVADDPAVKIANFPEKTRDAIAAARLVKGMTRAQVLMSVGYPVASENHNLNDNIWKFWLNSFSEFDVVFDDDNRLKEVDAIAETKAKVFVE